MKTILVVEDDIWQAEQYVRTLEKAGFEASYVIHALSAIDEIDRHPPDAIVLDVFLAGPNGFVLLHELRSYSDIGNIPAILCTGSAESITGADLASYGVVQVLDKASMVPEDLVVAVKKALS